MVQWEYCRITWLARQVTDNEIPSLRAKGFHGDFRSINDLFGEEDQTWALIGELRYANRPRQEAEIFTELDGMLTRLGLEGWELVSVLGAGDGELWFKRPVQA